MFSSTTVLKNIIIVILALIGLPAALWAQACCSGGTPLAGNIGLRPISVGDLYFDLTYDYNTQRSLLSGSEVLDDNRRARNTNALLLRGSYGLTDKLAVTGMVSWINEIENVEAFAGDNRFSATGIGDALLIAQYNLIQKQFVNLLFGTGVKFPLGRTDIRDPETGLLLNPDLQPGSGSWDLILSARFEKQHVWKDNLTFIAELTSRLNTEADRFEGQQAYQFGREYRLNIGFRDRYLVGHLLIDPTLNFLYRRSEADQVRGSTVPNTGGHWVHMTPGVNWQTTPAFTVGAAVGIPLYRNLTGTQLTTTNRFTLTLSYQISGGTRGEIAPGIRF